MAQGNPYARFVEVMKRQGRAMNEPAMTVGIVTGVDPVSISVDGVPIAEHIYCNQVTSSNKDEELAAILEQEEYVSPALKGFLKELCHKHLICTRLSGILLRAQNLYMQRYRSGHNGADSKCALALAVFSAGNP